MTSKLPTAELGRGGPEVTGLCFGTSALSGMPQVYGYDVDGDTAVATIVEMLGTHVNIIDTSNGYGPDGAAERRLGAALSARDVSRDLVISTKVDPDPKTGAFDGDRVLRSLAESLDRIGVDRVPILHLHDPERIGFDAAMAAGGAVEALVELRAQGVVDHIGVAGGDVALLTRFVETGAFDVLLVHNRYTLLDRSAAELFHLAADRGLGVMNAAPYGGGLLAKGPDASTRYAYREVGPEIVAATRAMQESCAAAGTTLATAALQFSLRAEVIDTTVVGVSTPERVCETITAATAVIPDALLDELERLVPEPATWSR